MTNLIALLFALTYATAAQAQSMCATRDTMIGQLSAKYGESRVGVGVAQGGILEIWASPDGETWTAVMTYPNGATCITAAGKNWIAEPLPMVGDPA